MLIRCALGTALLFVNALAWAGTVVIPADVSVQLSAYPNSGLATGQPITFTFSATNHGPEPVATLVVATSHFTNEFNLALGASDCQDLGLVVVDGKTYYYYYDWVPSYGGPIGVGETRSCHLTLPVSSLAPNIWTFGLLIPSSFQDLNPTNNNSMVTLRRGLDSARAIPTLSRDVLLLLALLLLALAANARRSRG